MSGLKQLRQRVKSIKSTQKVTKAMHIVSAAKLKKIKERAEALNDYSAVLGDVMYEISNSMDTIKLSDNDRKFFSKGLVKLPRLLIVMTSERGLCGSFNSSVIKKVKDDINKLEKEGVEVKLLLVGKKGYNFFIRSAAEKIVDYYHVTNGNYECISREVKDRVISMVERGEVGSCYMYYNEFKNAMTQIMTIEQILPAKAMKEKNGQFIAEYEYEGSSLIHNVISLYIHGEINYGLLQSRASEEGARMTSMDNATRNAGELIDELTLKLNRSRQAIITTELTEIISGAEAI